MFWRISNAQHMTKLATIMTTYLIYHLIFYNYLNLSFFGSYASSYPCCFLISFGSSVFLVYFFLISFWFICFFLDLFSVSGVVCYDSISVELFLHLLFSHLDISFCSSVSLLFSVSAVVCYDSISVELLRKLFFACLQLST